MGREESRPAAFDAVVVGAGFAGLYMLHRLRGLGLRAVVLEAGDDVGGTWYWNRYPGARCDIESVSYSYSFDHGFEQEWRWTERNAAQPEILAYIEHVAERFDLRRDIRFATRVVAADFDETAERWTVRTDAGDAFAAPFLLMATGCLSLPKAPDFPGLSSFRGPWFHTGDWPAEGVDFTGQRVGIVGTGSSGIQAIPVIAEQASHLTVFQRTANFSIPAANHPLDPAFVAELKADYGSWREASRRSFAGVPMTPSAQGALEVDDATRQAEYEKRWAFGGVAILGAYNDLLTNEAANATAADFIRGKIRSIVRDPATAELLCPDDHPLGTKRVCRDTGYYETYNRENVALVDVRTTPIAEITPTGLRTTAAEYELDALVFAIGFDAMTGALVDIDLRGRGGRPLRDAWADGPRTYLGLQVAGFPNLFTITGPGSPSVLSNMVCSIEQHVDFIADAIVALVERGATTIETTIEAQDAWMEHVAAVGDRTLFPRARSWYTGANVPGKKRVFMPYVGGVGPYRERCEQIVAANYAGFALQ